MTEAPIAAFLVPMLFVAPLMAFYLWMFHHMLNNRSLTMNPLTFLGASSPDYAPDAWRNTWTLAFLVLNVVAAALVTEHRGRS